MRRVIAGAVVLLVALAGCVGPEPAETPARGRGGAPVFASDEEALAAAEAAYAAYLAVSDAISSDGGADPERLAASVTASELREALELYDTFRKDEIRTVGVTTFDSAVLQRADDYEVATYLCLDVSDVRVLNVEGIDVTPAKRASRVPLEVVFLIGPGNRLLLDSSDVWQDGDLCGR